MADSTTELIYSPTAEEMKNVMINSDIAVSAAGQTLGELARVGVPAIAIGIADNQINNVRGWSNVGCIEYAGWHDDTYLREKLLSCIASLSPIESSIIQKFNWTRISGWNGKFADCRSRS